VAALLRQWPFGGVEGGRPERDRAVEVVTVDAETGALDINDRRQIVGIFR
jgi:hypothetical protein